ncbi:MAG: hypothetical protein HYV75_10295 [Opitutae bacterium]|nr:hypothetical protein [Opitutae bacterium]
MKPLLRLLLAACLLSAARAEKIDLGAGRAVLLTVPAAWTAGELPAPPPGVPIMSKSLRFVTKSGSNDSVMLTLVPVPDDHLADPEVLRAMVDQASQQFVAGSVEGRVVLKELKLGPATGFAVTFTDASLVGKPTVKEDYKSMTSCFVYLGHRVLVSATIFSDDVNGKAYAEALRLLKSISLQLPGNAI